MQMMSSTKRQNGLSSPYSRMQMTTWFVLPTLVLEFLFFVSPVLPLAASIVCTFIFLALCAASALFGFMATAIDPIDPRLSYSDEQGYKELFVGSFWKQVLKIPCFRLPENSVGVVTQMENHDHEANGENENPHEATKYCWVCEHDVADQSMHCRYCNKCVAKFDHHCQWLNNCVGERNYPFFYKTLWSIAILLVTHASISLCLSIDILAGGTSKQRASNWFNANLSEIVASVNIFFVIFDLVCLILILQLLIFHIKLRAQNLTTYKFILHDNAAKRELKKEKAARLLKRKLAMHDAKQKGQPLLRCRLFMGEKLRNIHSCLDPLPLDESKPEDFVESQQEPYTNDYQSTEDHAAIGRAESLRDEHVEKSLEKRINPAEQSKENTDVPAIQTTPS